MRISDWSSDVCSSDLLRPPGGELIMAQLKPTASLSSGLLARKGQARPAMRPQGLSGFGTMADQLEDLGWNDMGPADEPDARSEEHTSELQSQIRISYAVFCLKKKKHTHSTD